MYVIVRYHNNSGRLSSYDWACDGEFEKHAPITADEWSHLEDKEFPAWQKTLQMEMEIE